MDVWVRQLMSVLREHFYHESHFNQILLVNGLLFMISLPTLLFVPWSLLNKIWMGIFFGTFIVDHIWHNRYPALKRWIIEREYVTLCKRFYNASRPDESYSVGILLLVVVTMTASISRSLLLFKIGLCIGYGICTLGFIAQAWHEWYPALKQKWGISYVVIATNLILGVAAYALACEYINRLTGVNPDNFIKALTVFTTFAMVPVWMMTIAIMAAAMAIVSIMGLPVIDILSRWHIINLWYWLRNLPRVRLLLGLPLAEKPDFPMTRFVGRMFGALGIFALCSLLLTGFPPVNRAVRVAATTVLVLTQYSHDRTCAVSSEHRRVAFLKDRKEMTASIVSIADVSSWPEISFTTGTCKDAIQS
jgi:hypothetical protein